MVSSKTLKVAIVSALVLVAGGCQSLAQTTPAMPIDVVDCKPAAPQLESYTVDEGGIYYPKRSLTNLMIYIEQLNACIDYHQARPG
ncbi:hypothetical protein VHP8226_04161 [Vibrio hippocampi]|uniref:Uncharacterized protein n=1 Tax=Vibrio hippocampi TaxID=654686 RepID=A0ABN8DTP2_9VIBR|nr:hypothetical protein VHP8226_04161 [Vibrio hippocampi]